MSCVNRGHFISSFQMPMFLLISLLYQQRYPIKCCIKVLEAGIFLCTWCWGKNIQAFIIVKGSNGFGVFNLFMFNVITGKLVFVCHFDASFPYHLPHSSSLPLLLSFVINMFFKYHFNSFFKFYFIIWGLFLVLFAK